MGDRSTKVDRESEMASFTRKCVTAVAVAATAFILWQLRHTVIVGFAAVVVAALLVSAAELVRRIVPIGHRPAVAIAGLVILVLLGTIGWFTWPQIRSQSADLLQQIPEAVQMLEERFDVELPNSLSDVGDMDSGIFGRLWRDVLSMAGTIASVLTAAILIVVAGAFLANRPSLYRDGLVLLVPKDQHRRARLAIDRTGRGLKLWLLAQLLSMTIVGVLVGLGAWFLGLPAPLALGLIGFLTEFVPLAGPVVGAIPGLLVASAQDFNTFLWTLLLYVAVQQVESNLITPIVQREVVTVPPALFMVSVVAMGALFGVVGVLLAGPLTVVAYALVRTLYVEGVLDEHVDRKKGV